MEWLEPIIFLAIVAAYLVIGVRAIIGLKTARASIALCAVLVLGAFLVVPFAARTALHGIQLAEASAEQAVWEG